MIGMKTGRKLRLRSWPICDSSETNEQQCETPEDSSKKLRLSIERFYDASGGLLDPNFIFPEATDPILRS